MSDIGGFWEEGARASGRLARWCRDLSSSGKRREDRGDRALQALTDVGALRRALDQVEFEAIRVGRQEGRSWAEIAVRLGITRQSAWERWQDVDRSKTPLPEPDKPWAPRAELRYQPEQSEWALAQRSKMRRQATVVVPNVTGMALENAREILTSARLTGVAADPDGPPLDAVSGPDDIVTDQAPESGAMARAGTTVRLWTNRDGGSGVREPRRPGPDPKVGRKMLDEATDEAVG